MTESNTFPEIEVRVAQAEDAKYSKIIADEMEASAKARGTGIAKRDPNYISKKMEEGKAVIAFTQDPVTHETKWVGFCYIEAWGHEEFVANSGLIVAPDYRKTGVATRIKRRIFQLSRERYPNAKIFGLTTGLAVMKMNSELGYVPVTYSELTDDNEFWTGCKSCVNYEILMSKDRKNCLCTGMLYDPKVKAATVETEIKKEPEQLTDKPIERAIPTAGLTFRHQTLIERLLTSLKGHFIKRFQT